MRNEKQKSRPGFELGSSFSYDDTHYPATSIPWLDKQNNQLMVQLLSASGGVSSKSPNDKNYRIFFLPTILYSFSEKIICNSAHEGSFTFLPLFFLKVIVGFYSNYPRLSFPTFKLICFWIHNHITNVFLKQQKIILLFIL